MQNKAVQSLILALLQAREGFSPVNYHHYNRITSQFLYLLLRHFGCLPVLLSGLLSLGLCRNLSIVCKFTQVNPINQLTSRSMPTKQLSEFWREPSQSLFSIETRCSARRTTYPRSARISKRSTVNIHSCLLLCLLSETATTRFTLQTNYAWDIGSHKLLSNSVKRKMLQYSNFERCILHKSVWIMQNILVWVLHLKQKSWTKS